MSETRISRGPMSERRAVIGAGLGLAPWLVVNAKAKAADAIPPQPGDRFVHLTGPKKGQVVSRDDLALGGPQMQAYPIDPGSFVVRNGSRLNLIVLARFDPAELSADARARAADGVVAYSGVCTHQGCPVNMWSQDQAALVCSCHGSRFNPKDGANVTWGPAPRALPSLGLKLEDGAPVVAAGFSARVGPAQA
jgi:rieske iron-sulfur protein